MMAKKRYAEGGQVRKQGVVEGASRLIGKVLGEKDPMQQVKTAPKATTAIGGANKGNKEALEAAGMRKGGVVKKK